MKSLSFSALVALGIAAPIAFPSARAGGSNALGSEQNPQVQQVDTIVIQIVPDADSVVAVPNSVQVRRGQVVTWSTDLGDWMVRLQSDQPFGEQAVGDGIRGNRGQRNGRAVRREAAFGAYKYDIMVVVPGGPPLTADPEIVVAPEGSW